MFYFIGNGEQFKNVEQGSDVIKGVYILVRQDG